MQVALLLFAQQLFATYMFGIRPHIIPSRQWTEMVNEALLLLTSYVMVCLSPFTKATAVTSGPLATVFLSYYAQIVIVNMLVVCWLTGSRLCSAYRRRVNEAAWIVRMEEKRK